MVWIRAITFLVTILAAVFYAHSEEASDIPALPAGTGPLPDSKDEGQAGIIINSANALEYKNIIIPDLFSFVRSGNIEMDAVRSVRYVWRFDEEWEKNSETALKISPTGSLPSDTKFTRAFPFGPGSVLKEEKDPKVLGAKILWNIASNFWGMKLLNTEFELIWVKDAGADRRVGGKFVRIYPRALGVDDKTPQIFREKISFESPLQIKGFAWLTFRFLGSEEDGVWVFSPAIHKARQLTGSNRSDVLIKSSVSADDFLSWSGKPELVEAVVERTMVGLVPAPDIHIGNLEPTPSECLSVTDSQVSDAGKVGSARWNFENRKFPQGAAWLPNYAVFYPRELWRVELSSKDPYALYGRQILYVDTLSMLPYYKIVYDRAGRLWKTVISAFGLSQSRDKKRKVPYQAFFIVNDHLKKESYIVDFSKIHVCDGLGDGFSLADFDPRRLGDDVLGKADS